MESIFCVGYRRAVSLIKVPIPLVHACAGCGCPGRGGESDARTKITHPLPEAGRDVPVASSGSRSRLPVGADLALGACEVPGRSLALLELCGQAEVALSLQSVFST